jgi:magnesium and cobalt transporter
VAGDASIAEVNEAFTTLLPEDAFDTIGGLVAHEHGRVPRRGETVVVGGLRFTVMLTRGGAVRWFKVTRVPIRDADESGA